MEQEQEMPAEAEKPLADNQVRLAGAKGSQVFDLRLPASLAIRYQVRWAVAENDQSACAAALGLCVHKIGHAVGRYVSPAEYGIRVSDWLLEQGVPYADIYVAGRRAWAFLCRDLATAAEVKETEDFFGPKTEPSTSR